MLGLATGSSPVNGHIGFNEPEAVFEKGTHCVALTESTIEAYGDVTPEIPASILQMHSDVSIVGDRQLYQSLIYKRKWEEGN